jgi:predicted TIM-barrel fold metal-dependent hydrolase
MIIDAHTHVASTRFTPRDFYEGVARNMAASAAAMGIKPSVNKILDLLLTQNQDHEADVLVATMAAADVDRAVLLLPDFTHVMSSEHTIAEMAEMHARIRAKHPGKFHVFQGVDPRWGRDGLDLFVRCVDEYGFEGLKLYPPCGYSPSDPSLFPFYEVCAERGLPVLLHTGPTSPALSFAEAHPDHIDQAAMRFPTVNFILAHGGVVNREATIQQCRFRPNVFCDISGFLSLGGRPKWAHQLRELFAEGLNHKIIFGTDWPVFKNKEDHASVLKTFGESDGPMSALSERERQRILSGNILGLLPDTAKSISNN